MESLVTSSSFLKPFPINPPHKKPKHHHSNTTCSLQSHPWSLSSGNLNKPNPNPKSNTRRNQGSLSHSSKWIKRTPEQMVRYLEDDRHGHLYGKHVVAAIKRVRSLSAMGEGEYEMREVMASFVAKLTFSEMCIVLKEQNNWRQVRDFFQWMKWQLSYEPSVVVYTIVLRAYGKVGKIKLAEETFLEMLAVGCEPDEVACGTMLCSYARWGRHEAMLSFYSAVHERGVVPLLAVYNFMMSSLQKKALHTCVVHVWRKMIEKNVVPDYFAYTVVVNSFVKGGMVEEAFRTFEEMISLKFVPEEATYSLLINLAAKCSKRDEAFSLYEDMRARKIVPSNFTCASLLALYYKNGDYPRAYTLFTEMEKYGVKADEVIHGLMIRIYGKLGLYEDAQVTFEEIKRSHQLSNEKTYAAMAQVHLNFGNPEKALTVMELMKNNNSISCSRYSLIVLLQCYIVKGDLASAEMTYRALSKTGIPDVTSCKNMLNLYLRLGLSEKAKVFVAQIRKDQIEFDEELFMTVMKVYCKGGMLVELEQLIKKLSLNENFKGLSVVQTFGRLLGGATKTESLFDPLDKSGPEAVELVLMLCLSARNEMKIKGTLELLLKTKIGESEANQIFTKLARQGDMLTAEYLYQLMMKCNCRIQDDARASMMNLYGKHRKLKQAMEVYEAAADSVTAGNVLNSSMVDTYVASGREEDAYLFYTEQIVKGHTFGPVSISKLVNALIQGGAFVEAENVIYDCFNKNLELDTVVYNTFIKAMLEAGKLHFAVRIYERMLDSNMSPSIQTYNTMISVYGRSRNLDKAVDMLDMARSKGEVLDEKIYSNLICQYGKAGKIHEASALFSEMQEEGIKLGPKSYNIMMNIYAGEGLYKEAEDLLQSMQKKNCSPDSRTYLAMIRAYAKHSKFSEAEEVITLMQKKGVSVSCAHFNSLILAVSREGLVGEADRIYRNICSTGFTPDLECKRTMLKGYLDFGHVEEGIEFFEKECSSVKPDLFVLSAAVKLYESTNKKSMAEGLLSLMKTSGVPFLGNLEVGTKTKAK